MVGVPDNRIQGYETGQIKMKIRSNKKTESRGPSGFSSRTLVLSGATALCSMLTAFPAIQSASAQSPLATSGQIVIGHSTQCVDLPNGDLGENVPINQFPCDGSPEQGFAVAPAANGYYNIKSGRSGKCLTILNSSTADNISVVQSSCNGSASQSFSLVHVGNDFYNIAASHSGKCINVPNASMAENTGLTQLRCNGTKAQMFWFQDLVGRTIPQRAQVQQPVAPQPQPQRPPVRQQPVQQQPVRQPQVQQPPVQQPTVQRPQWQQPKVQQPPVQKPQWQQPQVQQPPVQKPQWQQPKVQQPAKSIAAISTLSNKMNFSAETQTIAASPDDSRIATGGKDNTLSIWDSSGQTLSGTVSISLQGRGDLILDTDFSPNSKRVVTGSRQNGVAPQVTVNVWDATTGAQALVLQRAPSAFCDSVAYGPQGLRIAAGCFNQTTGARTLQVWDANTGAQLLFINGVNGPVAFSPDGTRVTGVNNTTREFKLYDTRNGQLIQTIQGNTVGGINEAVFTPDNAYLITGNREGSISVWSIATGQQLSKFSGHTSSVNDIAINKDVTRIASAHEDGMLILWDGHTGNRLSSFQASKRLLSVMFSSDGSSVVSGGGENIIRVFAD